MINDNNNSDTENITSVIFRLPYPLLLFANDTAVRVEAQVQGWKIRCSNCTLAPITPSINILREH